VANLVLRNAKITTFAGPSSLSPTALRMTGNAIYGGIYGVADVIPI
jgi:hypothetical protein